MLLQHFLQISQAAESPLSIIDATLAMFGFGSSTKTEFLAENIGFGHSTLTHCSCHIQQRQELPTGSDTEWRLGYIGYCKTLAGNCWCPILC